jgi:hypothetical protein
MNLKNPDNKIKVLSYIEIESQSKNIFIDSIKLEENNLEDLIIRVHENTGEEGNCKLKHNFRCTERLFALSNLLMCMLQIF